MSEPRSPREWKTLYAAAMLESESTQLRQRIERADSAMRERLKELPERSTEKIELETALKYLGSLRATLTSR
jgi:hypothetical protein